MKRAVGPAVALSCSLMVFAAAVARETASASPPAAKEHLPAAIQDGISVYFSPDGGAAGAITDQIGRARKTIDVQAFLFTANPIVRALALAHERGVRVRVLLDKSNETDKDNDATYLFKRKVPVF